MTTITAGPHNIELYSSIKELPIARYKAMQQYLLQESGIGSTIEEVDHKFSKLISFMEHKSYDDAKEELANLRYTFFAGLAGLDFKTKAFACMIKAIDGEAAEDLSSEGLSKVVDMLLASQMSVEELDIMWERIKKKLIPNYGLISPDGLEMTLSTLKT